MKIVLFAHGTRGDVAPMVALGWQLTRNGHDVTAAVPVEFQGFVNRAGLGFAPLPFDMIAWLGTAEGRTLLHVGGIPLLRGLAHEYELRADSFDDAYVAAGREPRRSSAITSPATVPSPWAMRGGFGGDLHQGDRSLEAAGPAARRSRRGPSR